MGRLDGRVAIVTGASRGLGRAMALALGAEGAAVAVVARTEQVWDERLPGTIGETVDAIERAQPVMVGKDEISPVGGVFQRYFESFGEDAIRHV